MTYFVIVKKNVDKEDMYLTDSPSHSSISSAADFHRAKRYPDAVEATYEKNIAERAITGEYQVMQVNVNIFPVQLKVDTVPTPRGRSGVIA